MVVLRSFAFVRFYVPADVQPLIYDSLAHSGAHNSSLIPPREILATILPSTCSKRIPENKNKRVAERRAAAEKGRGRPTFPATKKGSSPISNLFSIIDAREDTSGHFWRMSYQRIQYGVSNLPLENRSSSFETTVKEFLSLLFFFLSFTFFFFSFIFLFFSRREVSTFMIDLFFFAKT